MVETSGGTTFSVEWVAIAFGVGIALQILGWVLGFGIFTGLPAYFLVGLLTAWGSPGDTLLEPGVAAFLIALVGYVLDHILLSIFLVGIPLAIVYGVVGMVVAVVGAYLGERFLD